MPVDGLDFDVVYPRTGVTDSVLHGSRGIQEVFRDPDLDDVPLEPFECRTHTPAPGPHILSWGSMASRSAT